MFCVEEHKWDYFTRIYIGALGARPHLGDAPSLGGMHPHLGARSLRARTYAYIIFTLRRFFVPCFIFITKCIDNQYFQEMKHWHSMFHF